MYVYKCQAQGKDKKQYSLSKIIRFEKAKEARLAQLVEHETFNLRVVGSSPTLGVELILWSHCSGTVSFRAVDDKFQI